jgi:uracil-DNA glycosylase family 4
MFTGDSSGSFLYRMLYEKGLANQPTSSAITDGLTLNNIFITAVGRCAPPDNKPLREEIENCRPYLEKELDILQNVKVLLALGKIAFDHIQIILRDRDGDWPKLEFSHGLYFSNGKISLIASYHPSQQITQTGRLTREMFSKIGDLVVKAAESLTDDR